MSGLIKPYGSWKSPITSDLIVSSSVSLSQPTLDGSDIYWVEMRPSEGGRNVIVRRDATGATTDINPAPLNARTRVHEYGGGDFIAHRRAVYFSNFADQRLYVRKSESSPQPITPESDMRYADAVIDHHRERLVCVREDHIVTGEPANTLISLRLDQNDNCGEILTSGNDFYSSPRISPDGRHLAWITWNHPNMPWDGTELWLAEFAADGALANQRLIAGGPKESVVQPEWSPSGELYFVSDRSGWWNIYRQTASGCVPVHEMAAEFALPQWLFRFSSYAFLSAELIICSYVQQGFSHLAVVDTTTGNLTVLSDAYTDVSFVRAEDGRAIFRGGSGSEAPAIVEFDQQSGSFTVLRRSNDLKLDKSIFSIPKPIQFPTEGNQTAHGIFYPPCNPTYAAPENDLPPLLVKSHGGPTSAAGTALSLVIQYWTSRGVAVLDVNYGGSTGFGRAYRERLKNNWGVVDVEDCVNGARYLVEHGEVDPNRLMITGGSAGGYTTLCALTFKDTFKAGASHYGVSDAEALARDTHKFESRYLDGLFGPYPEKREVYFNRSPLNFASQLSCPVIFFQGLEDKVVPPNQAEMMVEVLRKKGIAVAYVAFPGEQHGFRQALNIKRSLDAELYFYSRVFGFDLAEAVEPVEIENLPG